MFHRTTSRSIRLGALAVILTVVAAMTYLAINRFGANESGSIQTPGVSSARHQQKPSRSEQTPPTTERSCGVSPGVCGFPDGSSAGVSAGVSLKRVPQDVSSGPGWSWNSGGWVDVTGANAVFSGYQVAGSVNVTGDGATVQNCRISYSGGGGASFGVAIRHASNVTVQHCDISGVKPSGGSDDSRLTTGVKDVYGDAHGTKVVANDIFDVSCGVQMDSGLIKDNYIHNLGANSTDHIDGVMSNSGGALTIEHNTILNQFEQTSAIALYEDFGVQSDKTVTDNLLAGGGYTVYGGGPDHGRGAPSNMKFTDNRFSTIYHPNSGSYGPVASFDPSAPGNRWTNNTWDKTGEQLRP